MSSLEPIAEDDSEGVYPSNQSSTQSKSRKISDILARSTETCKHHSSFFYQAFLLEIQDFPEETREKKNHDIYVKSTG